MKTDTPLTDHEASLTATGLYVTAEYARGLETAMREAFQLLALRHALIILRTALSPHP